METVSECAALEGGVVGLVLQPGYGSFINCSEYCVLRANNIISCSQQHKASMAHIARVKRQQKSTQKKKKKPEQSSFQKQLEWCASYGVLYTYIRI